MWALKTKNNPKQPCSFKQDMLSLSLRYAFWPNKLCCHVVGALNAKLISSLFHRQGIGVCLIWNLSVLLYSQRTGVFKAGKIGSVPVLGMHQSFIMTFFVMPNCDITRPKCLHSHGHQLLFELCTLFHGFHSVSESHLPFSGFYMKICDGHQRFSRGRDLQYTRNHNDHRES